MAALFVQHALAEAMDDALQLTRAGYRAVGLRPPRTPKATAGSCEARVSMRDVPGQEEGVSLAELIAVTGWLPHTTRAALSRLRTSGDALGKTKRADMA